MLADWINLLLFGGLLGAVGQGARAVVGLKKIYDDALVKGLAFAESFKPNQLVFSLLIGFIAGALGITGLVDTAQANWSATLQQSGKLHAIVPTLIAIGYAGTDFIEGFIQKSLPKEAAGATTATQNPVHAALTPNPTVGAKPTPTLERSEPAGLPPKG